MKKRRKYADGGSVDTQYPQDQGSQGDKALGRYYADDSPYNKPPGQNQAGSARNFYSQQVDDYLKNLNTPMGDKK